MSLDKFLGSKVKADILKFLYFSEEGISLRNLESKLWWSFPAIKKQIDILEQCNIIYVDKKNNAWCIYLNSQFKNIVKDILVKYLNFEFDNILKYKYGSFIYKYIYGDLFGNKIGIDLVIIYLKKDDKIVKSLKKDIDNIISKYFIKVLNVTFFNKSEFENRYRLWDKFVLKLVNLID